MGFWLLFATAIAAACSAAFVRRIRSLRILAILTAWSGSVGAILQLHGIMPAIITAAASGSMGALIFIASLVRSGIAAMPNCRYEKRDDAC